MSETIDNAKKVAGEKACDYVTDGMMLGLGTGSTVYYFLKKLSQKVKEGLKVFGIPTSKQTEEYANQFGIPLTDFSITKKLDLTVDGADEVDVYCNLIKGGGGALLREKIIAQISERHITVAGSSKLVDTLGNFPLAVEVVPFSLEITREKLVELGCETRVREKGRKLFITDNGNNILDCQFGVITQPAKLEANINKIPGVIENGLFIGLTDEVILGNEDGSYIIKNSYRNKNIV